LVPINQIYRFFLMALNLETACGLLIIVLNKDNIQERPFSLHLAPDN
jgi:hypothetical protein